MMILPSTISEATRTLKNLSNEAKILAGGTWVMRAPIRDEYEDKIFVSLKNISSLYKCEIKNNHISLGALMTHQHIAEKLSNIDELQCLKQAVLASANPAIRGMATIGGNICTSDFLASDLVPALIASDAKILFQSCESKNQMPIEQYLKTRTKRQKDEILTSIQIPRGDFRSAHVRLLMRKAGEYPIANLSIRYSIDETGSVQEARIVVGAVESTVRRWIKLENALNNKKLSNLNMLEIAKGNLDEFIGRDGPDAPGWYRTRVLPRLLFDAFAQTAQEFH
jgi:aerobic carbon-monoxide dehydrogenase medium subunit